MPGQPALPTPITSLLRGVKKRRGWPAFAGHDTGGSSARRGVSLFRAPGISPIRRPVRQALPRPAMAILRAAEGPLAGQNADRKALAAKGLRFPVAGTGKTTTRRVQLVLIRLDQRGVTRKTGARNGTNGILSPPRRHEWNRGHCLTGAMATIGSKTNASLAAVDAPVELWGTPA
ncbi:MAG: hypothetical protein ACLQOO_12985 [Terriglobia bacterium]